uniref:FH2 domain-containing protein n=1 Tax=Ascaris lumbricoides TaxID=6252 RepID=A0A0M3HHJ1_ASCLU
NSNLKKALNAISVFFLDSFNEILEIKQSVFLPKVFCMLVQIGNFLNANGSCGNAAGFKLNSLWKIVDMKATKKSITLLHFIAMTFNVLMVYPMS